MLGRKAVTRAAWAVMSTLSIRGPVEVSARACPAAALLTTSQLWSAQWRQASSSTQAPFAATQALVEAAQAQQFQPRLAELRQQHSCLPFSQLVAECQKSLSPGSEEDAERVCTALHSAGVIMRAGGLALLRPEDIARVAAQVLPLDQTQLRRQLAEAEAELAPMERRRQQLLQRVGTQRAAFKWGGLALLAAHFGIFTRLTFYELSWDVMEPVAFLVSCFGGILAYTYFMRTESNFTWSAAQQRFVSKWEDRALKRGKFNEQRYSQLQRDVQRYSEMLQAQQQLQPSQPQQ